MDDVAVVSSVNVIGSYKKDSTVKNLIFTDYQCLHITWSHSDISKAFGCEVYFLYSEEICPTTGRKHFQGYIQLSKKQRFSRVTKILPGIHFRPAFRSYQENRNYIAKLRIVDLELARQDPVKYPYPHPYYLLHEGGELLSAGQGDRTDLDEMVSFCKTAKNVKEIIEKDGSKYCRYRQGFLDVHRRYQSVRTESPIVYWFYGPTGSGKSRTAYEMAMAIDSDNEPFRKNSQSKFWDGYDNQKVVIFEDFRYDQMPFSYLLQLLDRYPCLVDIKGTFAQFNSTHIFITCPQHPRQEYTGHNHETNQEWVRENIDQLLRRISEIHQFEFDPSVSIEPKTVYHKNVNSKKRSFSVSSCESFVDEIYQKRY